MILVLLAALCVLTVPLTGGHLTRLAAIELRAIWLPLLALALQLMITTVAPGGSHGLHVFIHIGTYGLLAIFLWVNRWLPGARVIALGAVVNAFEIAINGGVMPAAAAAQRIAGLAASRGFNNSAVLAHPHLLWLGDVIPVPGPLPNTLSAGDVIVFAGLLVLLHRHCRVDTSEGGPAATRLSDYLASRAGPSRSRPRRAQASTTSRAPSPARR